MVRWPIGDTGRRWENMEQISIAFTTDQIEALVLACGIAAKYSTAGNCERILEVRRQLIHALVIAQDIEAVYAKLHSGAEYGKVVD